MGATTPSVQGHDHLVDLRVVDALIPVVQRSASRAALLRDPHLEIAVGATGEIIAHFVVSASR